MFRAAVVANLLLEGLIDRVLAQMAEERAETCADCKAGKGDEEEKTEQHSPEATPHGSAACGSAAVAGGRVVLPGLVTGYCSDLIGLDDQIRLQALDRLPRPLCGRLIRVSDRNQRCHSESPCFP